MEVTDFDKVQIVRTDGRGRATLGSEFADEQVQVYVKRTPEMDELEEPSPEEKEKISALHLWATNNGITPFDYRPEENAVIDVDANRHEAPPEEL